MGVRARGPVAPAADRSSCSLVGVGDVIQISADRLTDPKTNNPYYTAFVRVDQDELATMPNIRLYPGMPATVMSPTIQRTAFDYIVGPLVMSFNHAFRQK
jgi:multidrug efflux pump subunit AcrA (membrane-fusion protein)